MVIKICCFTPASVYLKFLEGRHGDENQEHNLPMQPDIYFLSHFFQPRLGKCVRVCVYIHTHTQSDFIM